MNTSSVSMLGSFRSRSVAAAPITSFRLPATLQSDQAQANTDQQRKELQALYDEGHALAVDICDTVEFFYRKEDPGSLRTKAGRWGVVYLYEPGAPQPPVPAAPTPTNP